MPKHEVSNWPPIQFTISADGSRVSYMHFQGTGTPFLCARTPGAPTLSLLPRILSREGYDRFRRGRSLILFDWRGSGRSDPIQGELSIEDLGTDLDAVIDVVGGRVDAVVYGRASLAVCLHASREPERYRSLTVVAGLLRAEESFSGFYNRPGWRSDYSEHLRGLAGHYFRLDPDETVRFVLHWEQGVPATTFAAYLESDRQIDLTSVLPQIEAPSWVVAQLPIDHEPARKIAMLLPDSRLSIYRPSAGSPPVGGWSREQWDTWLGETLGDPPSVRTGTHARGAAGDGIHITPREKEVFALVAQGDTNLDIAKALGIAEGTVKRHVSNMLQKTGLKNRRQLMRFADRRGDSA